MTPDAYIALTDAEVSRIFEETEAIRTGHFKLTSGRHSDTYIQCARVMEHPRVTRSLAAETVHRLPTDVIKRVTMVASPAIGGLLFGYAIADVLDVPFIFSERVDGAMTLRRSFEIPPGARVLVAEDVITTGGSVREVIELVKANGGEVLGVVSLVDRGGVPVFGEPFFPLLRKEVPSWDPEECKLCRQGIEIHMPGSRSL